jgi:hypothetical protein
MCATCPIPFTVLGLTAVLTVDQKTNSKAPCVVFSSPPLLFMSKKVLLGTYNLRYSITYMK